MKINLNSTQIDNIAAIKKAAIGVGITNEKVIAALLAIAGKESNWNNVEEKSYRNTSNDRIRKIFSTRLGRKTDAQLDQLKLNDQAFFAAIYGGMLGNNNSGDGFRYRGRGFNQITGKTAYIQASKDTGADLLFHPELLNNRDIAAKAFIGFFLRNYPAAVRSGKYTISTNINSVPDINQAYDLAYNINRGKHSFPIIDTTGGYLKGKMYLPELQQIVKKKTNSGFWTVILIATGIFYLIKK